MDFATCPDCEAPVYVGSVARLGDLFLCPECEIELELVALNPPELTWTWDYSDDETVIYDDVDVE